MNRETEKLRDNRAVTPFFRIFGGAFQTPKGDAMRLADLRGGHRGEWRLLAILIPTVVGAALFDGLWRLGGPWLAWLALLPALFVSLNALAFAIGGTTPEQHYSRWSMWLTIWAVAEYFSRSSGGVEWAVKLWFGWMALEIVCLLGVFWRWAMALTGDKGIRMRWALLVGLHLLMALLWWLGGWPYGVACGAGISALLCWGTLNPVSRLYGPVAKRVEGEGWLLTVDDGPDPHDTPLLLDALDAAGVKAVFFVIGEKVAQHPELAREIVKRGHELGNHTLNHPQRSFWCAGSRRTRREIEGCSAAIEAATGMRPRWFRAPVGHRNYFTHPIAIAAGMEVIAWTHRGYDTVRRGVPEIVKQITTNVVDGDIMLMHEATPIAEEVLGGILEELRDRKPASQS
jgi:peptidoglycan/xylan/chitin deacetylase (PgdA/CDA1 family)